MPDYEEPDHCGGRDALCTCLCGKPHTMTDEEFQAKDRGRQCDGCAVMVEIEKMELEPPCICAEWDGRGWSVCGVPCDTHPPTGKCPKCEAKTHANRKCIVCSCKDGEE